jgi:tetratricopeptide (TPR) repeat protein
MVEDAISFWAEIQRYENMLSADPKSYCFAPLSELYRRLGLLDDAIAVARKGCALHPDYPGGFFALGAACFAKGMRPEARQALERVVALKPDHLEALKLLGQLFVETGQVDLARSALARVLAEDPDDTESALLFRSIASAKGSLAPEEEEVIEEVDIIDDLTEEPPAAGEAPADSGLAEVARALAEYDWVGTPPPAAQPAPTGAARGHEPGDLWAIEAAEEPEELWPVEAAEDDDEEEPATLQPAQPAAAAQQASRDPLTTATLAELYLTQGFQEKAAGVYRELLTTDPGNAGYRRRYEELTRAAQEPAAPVAEPLSAEAAAPAGAPAGGDPESQLLSWLENIRRRRDGV